MTEKSDLEADSTDYERVEDVEIEIGGAYLDFTDEEHQLVVVEGVGDMAEIEPNAPVPDEIEQQVERSSQGVIARTDAPGDHVVLPARVFRRFIFQGIVRRVKRPQVVWALLHAAYRDELELGSEIGGAS